MKKKLLIINEVCGHTSTGKICGGIADKYDADGWDVRIAYGRDGYVPDKYKKYAVRIGSDFSVRIAALETRFFDNAGFSNKEATKKFIKWADEWGPDVIWLHNLHGYYINIELLFAWIKDSYFEQVYWTLHDCWAFTGHCSYFLYVKCDKWKNGCSNCVQKREYPKSILMDSSSRNYSRKKKIFCGVKNMTIITPSEWLGSIIGESYLKDYNRVVVNNSIDLNVFKPTKSTVKEELRLTNQYIVLGVANVWNARKGYGDYAKLSKILPHNYTIVIVGVSEKQKKSLPENMLGIERTKDQIELAKLYTAADVFINLTYEDTYPTVNLEAEACGTPVITYNSGGSPESVEPENVIECGNIEAVAEKIKTICEGK